MLIRKMFSILCLALATAILVPVLHADQANQATKVTFSQPVQIPGKVLPAGSYWIQMARNGAPDIVQIFTEQHELIATLCRRALLAYFLIISIVYPAPLAANHRQK